jgi:two-component sensor histidine kinase
MTGYTREQVQRGALSWQALTPPEHLTVSEAQLEQMQRTDSIGPYEKEYLCADGSKRWMLFAGRRIEPNLISEYVIDITDKRRGEQERELLAQELSHRVKNTLAVVQALARQTRGGSVEAYREAFLGRLKALANGHSLLLQSDWQSAELGAIVDDAVAMYGDSAGRVQVEGAPVTVPAKKALSLSLVLHELAPNALKYGALSTDAGSVRIAWSIPDGDGGARVRMVWQERDGPAVKPPNNDGFGMQLIRHALAYELDGAGQAEWAQDGMTYEIEFARE